jgi:hypothetical protein
MSRSGRLPADTEGELILAELARRVKTIGPN